MKRENFNEPEAVDHTDSTTKAAPFIASALVLVACLLSLVMAALPSGAEAAQARLGQARSGPVAIARLITGAATMAPSNDSPPLVIRSGSRIPSGWYVWSLQGTILELTLPDSHVVRLGPAPTAIRWYLGRLQTTNVTVFSGATFHRVSHLSTDAAYRVTTPTRVAAVRGTEFSVEVGDNGAGRTAVKEGEVGLGEGEPEVVLKKDDEDRSYLIERDDSELEDTAWLSAQVVTDSEEADKLQEVGAEKMKQTNQMTAQDFVEMMSLTQDVLLLITHTPRSAGEIANALSTLQRGIRVFHRMSARESSMEARVTLAHMLGYRFGVSDEAATAQYAEYNQQRETNSGGLDDFVGRLESLTRIVAAAQTASRATSIINVIPGAGWFGR